MRDLMEGELNRKADDEEDDTLTEKLGAISVQNGVMAEGGACAFPPEQENEGEDVPPKLESEKQKQQIPNPQANLLTFHRQKLALLQCEYDPKCCSSCKKPGANDKHLKSCAKCKTAKYCSKECQTEDWKTKHKVRCQEIRKYQAAIEKEEAFAAQGFTRVRGVPDGKPWFLDGGMDYYKLCIRDKRLFAVGYHKGEYALFILKHMARFF